MRVPTNSNSTQMLDRINSLSARQSNLQTQVATGQRIFQPEDDPAAMGRVLTLNGEKLALTQFDNNTAFAMDWSNATISGLTGIKKISDRAGELATLGQGAISNDSLSAYAAEVDQLIEQTAQLANSKLRNDYLYGGTELSGTAAHPAPFELNTTTGLYEYWGDASQMTVPISENSTITPGTDGTQNNGIKDFLNNLISLRNALQTGNVTAVGTARTALESSENNLVDSISQQGAVQMRIEISKSQRTERIDNIDKLISKEADVDLPTAITKLNQVSLAYQAALQSTSNIMKLSLLDYLR